MQNRRSFSLGRLHLWTFVAALLAGILASLFCTLPSASAAALVVAVFVVLDLRQWPSKRCVGLLAVSYYACALALAVAASFVVLIWFSPASLPKSPLPFFDWLQGWVPAISEAIDFLVRYFLVFAILTLLSFSIAIGYWHKHVQAKWIVLLNVPGMLFISYAAVCITIAAIYER